MSEVLSRLEAAGVRLQRENYMFGASELPYLGYIVSREGRKTSPEKVAAVNQAKQPHNLTSLRAFMGLVNYYGVFIPKLATVAAPLHGLMKKDRRWSWGEEEEKAWQKIKKLLSSAKVFVTITQGYPFYWRAMLPRLE